MSLAQTQVSPPDRGASPLMSNNPFRNRIGSSTPRPVSTNPFLDQHEVAKDGAQATDKQIPSVVATETTGLFSTLTLQDHPSSPQKSPRMMPNGVSHGSEHTAYHYNKGAPPMYRPTHGSKDMKRPPGAVRRPTELDIFADPIETKDQSHARQPRRNSESSVMQRATLLLDPEDEKRRREKRSKDAKRNGTTKQKPSRKLDIIDKLDVTSIYGTGLFHHDGPFDACNPHRNRRRAKHPPMQAFPKDSANMQIGGSGPVNKRLDYDKFHGYGQEAHIDFNEAAVVDGDAEYVARAPQARPENFVVTSSDAVHGDETVGLGTSTFLEGAPASRAAIQRRESEFETSNQLNAGGLSRKKSFAQKIRGVRPRGEGRVQSPNQDRPPQSPPITGRSENGTNPFFQDYDKDYDKKGQQIAFAEEQVKTGRARALSSPKAGTALERQITGENIEGSSAPEAKPSGFLGRMKSLKKSKPRGERREPS